MYPKQDPIIALATPYGRSAIAVVRLSGRNVISIVNQVFSGKNLTEQPSHTIHFGTLRKGEHLIDEVLVSIFLAPHSFTKEEAVEISCHGSPFIVGQLIHLFVEQGVRVAQPGEFTKRAFLNGRFDLTQAEAVADLITADAALSHQIALHQMRGGFASCLQNLRKELIHFVAMLELGLDFSEEDVAFIDKPALKALAERLIANLHQLIDSFRLGNVIKQGVSVVLVGAPNSGKSTLLNALLQEEKAIVSPIAGTTRDPIEGQLHLEGILFRFVDTAGLRSNASDELEAIGIERARQQLTKAFVVLYLVDLSCVTVTQAEENLKVLDLAGYLPIKVGNKMDLVSSSTLAHFLAKDYLLISAQTHKGIDELKGSILQRVTQEGVPTEGTVIVNARHYDRLKKSKQALESVVKGLEADLSDELLIADIHSALYALGEITGDITTEEILEEIFAKFCIGK